MISLSKEQILYYYAQIMDITAGRVLLINEFGLDTALLSPFQSFGGKDLYPTLEHKIAIVVFCIIKNHPFLDGNKRTATHALITLLRLNGIKTSFAKNDLVKIGRAIANGTMSHEDLADLITKHITP
ncbi:MAG: type II toxin-antitoxin system death-on-curing family toxin [Defluviitaleaceae bacterium]|nr:type II toxin-antitoxin system death-on-curing family toxin [Defluviitaleaceae bacterium]